MAHQGANASRPTVDPREGLLLDLASVVRSVVAEAKARFDTAMAKSDAMDALPTSLTAHSQQGTRPRWRRRASTVRVPGLRKRRQTFRQSQWRDFEPLGSLGFRV